MNGLVKETEAGRLGPGAIHAAADVMLANEPDFNAG
jgi:hypothetical protein